MWLRHFDWTGALLLNAVYEAEELLTQKFQLNVKCNRDGEFFFFFLFFSFSWREQNVLKAMGRQEESG